RRPRLVALDAAALERADAFPSASPDAVLFLGRANAIVDLASEPSDVRTAFSLARGLMQTEWSRPVAIHYVHDAGSAEGCLYQEAMTGFAAAAMMENPHHAWSIVSRQPHESGVSKLQIALQEWLTFEARDKGGVSIVRFRTGHRERRDL